MSTYREIILKDKNGDEGRRIRVIIWFNKVNEITDVEILPEIEKFFYGWEIEDGMGVDLDKKQVFELYKFIANYI